MKIKTNPTTKSEKAFIQGIIEGKVDTYENILYWLEHKNSKQKLTKDLINDLAIRNQNLSKYMTDTGDKINVPNLTLYGYIKRIKPKHSYVIGWDLGTIKSIQFALNCNLDLNLIKNQWFIEKNKQENLNFYYEDEDEDL